MTTLENIRRVIAEFGWWVGLIDGADEGPAFAYTVGLHETFRHPESIIFGLPLQSMHAILNNCGELIRGGSRFEAGAASPEVLEGYQVRFRAVTAAESYDEYLGYGCRHYGSRDFPVLQCVWPDTSHKFPGETGAASFLAEAEPLLPRNRCQDPRQPRPHSRSATRRLIRSSRLDAPDLARHGPRAPADCVRCRNCAQYRRTDARRQALATSPPRLQCTKRLRIAIPLTRSRPGLARSWAHSKRESTRSVRFEGREVLGSADDAGLRERASVDRDATRTRGGLRLAACGVHG
jgi:hypothetical protein